MNPKEKAEELFSEARFLLSMPNRPLGEYKDQVAIEICKWKVDEIIKSTFTKQFLEDRKGILIVAIECTSDYWQEVRQELFNLK